MQIQVMLTKSKRKTTFSLFMLQIYVNCHLQLAFCFLLNKVLVRLLDFVNVPVVYYLIS